MIYNPEKKNGRVLILSIVLLVLAAVLYTLGQIGFGARMVFQLSALILLSLSIMYASRYLLTDYKYEILRDDDNKPCFAIFKVSGKRQFEMAHFEMSSIYAVGREKKLKEFEKKNGRVNKVFNYVSNFMPKERFCMAINFNNTKVMFIIEANEGFEKEIRFLTADKIEENKDKSGNK